MTAPDDAAGWLPIARLSEAEIPGGPDVLLAVMVHRWDEEQGRSLPSHWQYQQVFWNDGCGAFTDLDGDDVPGGWEATDYGYFRFLEPPQPLPSPPTQGEV